VDPVENRTAESLPCYEDCDHPEGIQTLVGRTCGRPTLSRDPVLSAVVYADKGVTD
jgi:hypothetical protein